MNEFWAKRLLPSRKGTRWDQVLFVLVAYRLLAPGSAWRLHREWYERSALADLLGADAPLCDIHTLYRCHERLLEHKRAVFDHLVDRWRDLFNVSFDVLLYDLTSTYFECDPPQADHRASHASRRWALLLSIPAAFKEERHLRDHACLARRGRSARLRPEIIKVLYGLREEAAEPVMILWVILRGSRRLS